MFALIFSKGQLCYFTTVTEFNLKFQLIPLLITIIIDSSSHINASNDLLMKRIDLWSDDSVRYSSIP